MSQASVEVGDEMRVTDRERGSVLILLLGIVATLAIMSVTLVTLVVNVQHNTYSDRMRAKAFSVTEGALDIAMQQLSASWPTGADVAPVFDTTAFREKFDTTEFPNPPAGREFCTVTFVDDVNPNQSWDDGNGFMFIDAQGCVGPAAARIRAKVQGVFFDLNLLRGVPVWSGGTLPSNGFGNNPKITVEVFPPGDTSATIISIGGAEPDNVGASYINLLEGPDSPPRNAVIPDATIEGLINIAQTMVPTRYFDGITAISDAENSPGGFNGLCVIVAGRDEVVRLPQAIYNSESRPGVILVLGGASIELGGQLEYYGVLYTEGTLTFSHGTPIVHGMLVAEGGVDMRGTADVRYNDRCVRGLSRQWQTSTRLVPNYWRELKPEVPEG